MGIAGGLGRDVALRLKDLGHTVCGIDRRPWYDAPSDITAYELDLRKRAAEDVFRRFRPDCVVHMGTVSARTLTDEQRARINLGGTRAVFSHCVTYGVKQIVFVGRHTYYGAAPDTPLYHAEDEPPYMLGTFPELADLVAADLFAANVLWRSPQIQTAVLRICYTLGSLRTGPLARFLSGKRVPMVLGYDPLFQFMHERDAISAIVLAVERQLRGIYNVAGPSPLPLSMVARGTARTPVPLPEPILQAFLGRFGFPLLPMGAIEHLKFPIVVDNKAFKDATGFQYEVDEVETLRRFRRSPAPLPVAQ